MSETTTDPAPEADHLRGRSGLECFRLLVGQSLSFRVPPGRRPRVGAEIELHTRPAAEPSARVELALLRKVLAELPAELSTSVEPGGQVELNGPPDHDMTRLAARARRDVGLLRRVLADHGIEVFGGGLDVGRPARRLLDSSRYRNMEAVFDRLGPAGRLMMNNTASLQITVDPAGEPDEAWFVAHRIGPCLLAAAASSGWAHPDLPAGEPWRSERHRIWESVDPSRVGEVAGSGAPVAEAWAQFALEAQVLQVPGDGEPVPAPAGLTLRRWITEGYRGTGPGIGQARRHMTTLFPWVRPRGPLEIRVMDAPSSLDPAPLLALVGVLMTRPRVWPAVMEATSATDGLWQTGARCGSVHPVFARALDDLVKIVTDELVGSGEIELAWTVEDWWAGRSRSSSEVAWSVGDGPPTVSLEASPRPRSSGS